MVPPDPNEIDIDDLQSISGDTSPQTSETLPPSSKTPTDDETLMRQLLDQVAVYYHNKTATPPTQHAILFPAQEICITYNKQPIISNLANFLQESERKGIREEYFEARMGIQPTHLPHLDTYAIARVLQRTRPYCNTYSKIIHKYLNTMTVNHKWKLGDPLCPFCKTNREDWKHIITCKNQVRHDMRKKCIFDFELALQQHHTYPPLADFIIEFITENNFDPKELMVINPRYCLLFHKAFHRQKQIGWENFSCGLIVFDWKCIQYKYFLQNKTKDIHTVDKWTRMVIKKLLEYYRVMWKQRCDIISAENELSYEGRQRKDMYSLCLYLKLHQNELYPHDTHYIDRNEAFFSKSPFDNVLMWKNRIETCLNNKNPSTTPIVKDENSIKQHFRVVRAKRKRGRPKKKQTKKETTSPKKFCITKKRK